MYKKYKKQSPIRRLHQTSSFLSQTSFRIRITLAELYKTSPELWPQLRQPGRPRESRIWFSKKPVSLVHHGFIATRLTVWYLVAGTRIVEQHVVPALLSLFSVNFEQPVFQSTVHPLVASHWPTFYTFPSRLTAHGLAVLVPLCVSRACRHHALFHKRFRLAEDVRVRLSAHLVLWHYSRTVHESVLIVHSGLILCFSHVILLGICLLFDLACVYLKSLFFIRFLFNLVAFLWNVKM